MAEEKLSIKSNNDIPKPKNTIKRDRLTLIHNIFCISTWLHNQMFSNCFVLVI